MSLQEGGSDTEAPLVSVVIPTYNRADVVTRAVLSVLGQSYRELEVIVVDDGSTDDTPSLMGALDDARIRYEVLGGNSGGAHARNVGIGLARGEYVAFLDSDDYWLPQKLERQVAVALEDANSGVVYTGVYMGRRERLVPNVQPQYEGEVFAELIRGWCPPTTSCVMVRRDVLQIRTFDETLFSSHDYELWIGLSLLTRFRAIAEPLVVFEWAREDRLTYKYERRLRSLDMIRAKWRAEIEARGLLCAFDANLARWRDRTRMNELAGAPVPRGWRARVRAVREARNTGASPRRWVPYALRCVLGDRAYDRLVRRASRRLQGIPRAPLEARLFGQGDR